MDLTVSSRRPDPPRHWSQMIQETLLSVGLDGPFGIGISGGAEHGQFCWIDDVDVSNIVYYTGKLHRDEVILEIQGQKVAGYTLNDLQEWLLLATNNNSPVLIKTIVTGSLTKDLREFLNTRFQKGSLDHDLQQTIRNNIYKRTVPCTTRLPRPGEVDGVDYKFLTLEEFSALEKNGSLLESGMFDGNYYGTPKPPKVPQSSESPFRRSGSVGNIVPGQHPSSAGKRRRNRSNIETNLTGSASAKAQQMAALERKKSLERVHPANPNQMSSNWDKGETSDAQFLSEHGAESVRWMDHRTAKTVPKDDETELPYGWEKVDDPVYGAYYIDHINKKTQYEPPSFGKVQQRGIGRDGQQGEQPDSPSSGLFSDKSSDRAYRKGPGPWTNGNRSPPSYSQQRYVFTRNPAELRGDFVTTRLIKSKKGLGFTIIGGDDSNEEFLQIKSIIPQGPAYEDGKLQRSDVLVYINDQCVLGYSHQDIITLFQSIPVGECVTLEVCRGYPLPFDPDDPNNEIITTVAVTLPSSEASSTNTVVYSDPGRSSKTDWNDDTLPNARGSYAAAKPKISDDMSENSAISFASSSQLQSNVGARPELHQVSITRGPLGFGFTIADSVYGQKVKQILDRPRCKILQEGDLLIEINGIIVKDLSHAEVVQVLKNCPLGVEAVMTVQRGGFPSRSRPKKQQLSGKSPVIGMDSRPQWNEDVPSFQKTPFPGGCMNVGHSMTLDPSVTMDPSVTPVPDVVTSECSKHVNEPPALETKESPVLMQVDSSGQSEPPGDERGANVTEKSAAGEEGLYRSALPPTLQNVGMRDLPGQRYSAYTEDDDLSQPGKKTDMTGSYVGNSRPQGYEYAGYSAPRRNFFSDFDERSASSHGTPPRREFVNQMSFSEFDKRPNVARSHSRSKTPGPDMMRNRAVPENDQMYAHRTGQELRSKTPTQELMSRMGKPISGTPDFIPASRYQAPSPSGRLPANDPALKTMVGASLSSSSMPSSSHMYGNAPVSGTRPITPSLKQINHQTTMKLSTSFENVEPVSGGMNSKDGWIDSPGGSMDSRSPMRSNLEGQDYELSVHLIRQETGFGFRIIGGTEEGSQVSVGHIVPGGAADLDGRLRPGDEITYIDNICVIGASHHKVVQLMGQSSNLGHVTIRVHRRPQFGSDTPGLRGSHPYDVTLMRREGEGFGFVIISSVTRSGSIIGKLVDGSPAGRCGKLHVGDQILAVNHINISHLNHEQIVNLIKESGFTVTLTISGPDDASSVSSITQRSTQSVPPASLGFQTQSESDMSRQSEYSPYHNSAQSRVPAYRSLQTDIEPIARDAQLQHMPFNPQMSAPDLGQADKFYSVELQRGSRGFGFSIRGGKEFNNMPLFVLKIAEGGAADVDGRLKVGDQIIEINSYNTNSMTHANAIDLIQSCNTSIRLLIKRSAKLLSGFSSSQLPGPASYLHNGGTPQDLLRMNDLRISSNLPERGYLYDQGVSQRYPTTYR